ncbi:hypothetical protein GPECTOR_1g395 [Gonium pectorale]|uniref:Guanylate cyclase domain-containing protein n=1 Tax=Gonium pectorale TaxID=33097 RepID=A0A150H2Z2_GONPE|nr:hypothetical protein GPECTOR_1g395 [Gonium pectorale]|eukprot:KXZ56441.1 hypothetical protein GPECTOR_1g395 [Gonium pectorale]
MRDYLGLQDKSYSLVSYDMSGESAKTVWSSLEPLGLQENVCVNASAPRGLMHPRTFLVMMYRADALERLHSAGLTPRASPPNDWEELIDLLATHRAAVRGAANMANGDALPEHGVCITTHPDCGRLGDVWSAIAASVVQTTGTTQGVYWDLTAPPPSATPLVNSTGWRYASDVLRQLLQYNAPDFEAGSIGGSAAGAAADRVCTDVSPLFRNGSCMITLDWDLVFSRFYTVPGLSVAPLPGSRVVMDRSSDSATADKLVNCTWELCAASANHDLLYLDPSPAALSMAPLAPESLVQVDGQPPTNCDNRAVAQMEAAAVSETGLQNASGRVPVNRAPYSVTLYTYAKFDDAALTPAVISRVASLLGGQGELLQAELTATMVATIAARRVANYTATNASDADPLHFMRTRWWTSLSQPFVVDRFTADGMPQTAAQWALSHIALTLEPPADEAAVLNATDALADTFGLVNEAFTDAGVRELYEEATGSVWASGQPQGPNGKDTNASTLVPLLVCLLVAFGVAVVALAFLLLRMRRRQRDLLGRVRAPRVGPDTSLLVSDVQNSTKLWEELSVATMDLALKIHHATIRRVMSAHDGYESATEGDSFIIAFATPAKAVAFASACQLALMDEEWPAELLQHPDGAVLLVDPRDTGLRIVGPHSAAQPSSKQTSWVPFWQVNLLWQSLRRTPSRRPSLTGSGTDSQRTSAGNLFASRSSPGLEEGLEAGEGSQGDARESRASGLPSPAVSRPLQSGAGGVYADEASQHAGTASDSRVSRSTGNDLVVGGGGNGGGGSSWGPGGSSTWGRVLAAAFPAWGAAAALVEVAQPRPSKAASAFDKKLLVFRGLCVRMGIHSGLDDPQYMVFNKVGSSYKYYGPFAETAKLVGDAATGGLITLSGQAFDRLRNGSGAKGGGSSGSLDTVVVYAGHFVLSEPPAKPERKPTPGCGEAPGQARDKGALAGPPADSQHVTVEMTAAGLGHGPAKAPAPEAPDEADAPLFVAVPSSLVPRLAHSRPLRTVRATQLGSLAAPTGTIAIAFLKVVGASTLLADLPGPASRALEQYQRLASRLLGEAGGYLVEGGDGLVLAAFGSPLAGVEWALNTVAGLKELDWEEELLAHELCEEVGLDVGAVTYSLTEASGRLSYRGKVMNRSARIAGTAAAGQVLCSGAVWLAAETGMALGTGGSVVGVSLGQIALKGISAPVEVVQCYRA